MEEYIYVIGWSNCHKQGFVINPNIALPKEYETGYIVFSVNADGTKKNLTVNLTSPLTLTRCFEVLAQAEEMTGNIYSSITIEHIIFDDDGRTLKDIKYTYNKSKNRMRIWDRGYPLYENWDGLICDDPDALADCLL